MGRITASKLPQNFLEDWGGEEAKRAKRPNAWQVFVQRYKSEAKKAVRKIRSLRGSEEGEQVTMS